MTREELEQTYAPNEQGIITTPGKFEGEMIYVPYFWGMVLDGMGSEYRFQDGSLVNVIHTDDVDHRLFPELGNVTELALEETDQGFINTTTDSTQIAKIREEYEREMNKPEIEQGMQVQESLNKAYQEGLIDEQKFNDLKVKVSNNPDIKDIQELEQILAKKVRAQEEGVQIGDKVEFPVNWMGESSYAQGEIVEITEGIAKINVNGDPKMPEWAPLAELTKITEYTPFAEAAPEDLAKIQREQEAMGALEAEGAAITASEDARKLIIQAMGYKDLQGQLRACFLIGTAEEKIWKSAVDQIKKKHGKEMKERVKALTKWGTVRPSDASVKDIIAKVLIDNGISAYPNLIEALYANPFQNRGDGPDEANQTMSEPR